MYFCYINNVFFNFEALLEISKLLNTGLDAETLAVCVRLCESGVNPQALAMVIQDLRRETAAARVSVYLENNNNCYKNINVIHFKNFRNGLVWFLGENFHANKH